MRRTSVACLFLLLGPALRAQELMPRGTAAFRWTSVNLLVVPDTTQGVGVVIVTQPNAAHKGQHIPYVFAELTFDPFEATRWVDAAESLAVRPAGGATPLTLVAHDSSLLVLAWGRAKVKGHSRSILAYYPRPTSAGDSSLDIQVDSADALAFLDSLRTKAAISRYDPNAPPADSTVLAARAVGEKPQVVSAPPVVYPEGLREQGVQGTVVIQAIVDTEGRVEPLSVKVKSATNPGFVTPAKVTILNTRFLPARVNGRRVPVLIEIPVNFTQTVHVRYR